MQLTNPLLEEIFNTKRNQFVSEEQKLKSQLTELQQGESEELKGLEELIKLLEMRPLRVYLALSHSILRTLLDQG